MRVYYIVLSLAALTLGPLPAFAQQPAADSLARQVRALQQRMDSLEREISRLNRGRADTSKAGGDELADLRAAANLEAGQRDTTAQRTDTARAFVNRTRMQTALNPEISVTGDVRLLANRPGPQADNVDLREFEFGFQSPLDPYAITKIFLSVEDGHFSIEEAYAYWLGLPGHVRVDLGRFRQQFGELNRWHLHGIPETEYPLVLHEYLSDEGLVGNGLGLYWVAPTEGKGVGTHEIWAQATLADNEVLFGGSNRLSVLGHLNNFWQLSPSLFFQAGASAVYGENPSAQLKSRLLGGDVRFSWRPPARALYRSFNLRAEGLLLRQETAGTPETRRGGYVSGEYQLSRRIFAGVRYDRVQKLDTGRVEWMVVPHLTWWQSEWVFLKAELQHDSKPTGTLREASDRLVLQAVWSIGPHKHETY